MVKSKQEVNDHKPDTEEKIIEAAKDVFMQKGMDGARMQEIADQAGINKALLHYYFRTKNLLFDKIYGFAFSKIISKIREIDIYNKSLFELIDLISYNYNQFLIKHPYMVNFIFQEVHRDPQSLVNHIKSTDIDFDKFRKLIKREIDEGRIIYIEAEDLILNIISINIFPYIGRPLLKKVLFKDDEKAFIKQMKKRSKTNSEFIINAIKK